MAVYGTPLALAGSWMSCAKNYDFKNEHGRIKGTYSCERWSYQERPSEQKILDKVREKLLSDSKTKGKMTIQYLKVEYQKSVSLLGGLKQKDKFATTLEFLGRGIAPLVVLAIIGIAAIIIGIIVLVAIFCPEAFQRFIQAVVKGVKEVAEAAAPALAAGAGILLLVVVALFLWKKKK